MSISRKKMQQNFSRAAKGYDRHAQFQQQQMRRVLARAAEVVPAGAKMLDIGCGTGLFAHEAREFGWQMTGVDAAFAMCAVAKDRMPGVVNADALALPFADGFFDAAVSSLCLQWVADKPAVFREILRVLKPGGSAIIMTLGSETLRELKAEVAHLPVELLLLDTSAHYSQVTVDAGFELLAFDDSLQTEAYANARALLESMRKIGAQSAYTQRTEVLPPQKMMQILREYDKKYASANGVTATWQPILLQLRKPV